MGIKQEITRDQLCQIHAPKAPDLRNKSVALQNDTQLVRKIIDGEAHYFLVGTQDQVSEILSRLANGETGLTKIQNIEKNLRAKALRNMEFTRLKTKRFAF